MQSSQALAHTWPATTRALDQTYRGQSDWQRTTHEGRNDDGYILAALSKYSRVYQDLHQHRQTPRLVLDEAAAGEVWYQWSHRRTFRRAAAGLAACICALPSERPERIFAAQARRVKNVRV
jgi:hypothetical protein